MLDGATMIAGMETAATGTLEKGTALAEIGGTEIGVTGTAGRLPKPSPPARMPCATGLGGITAFATSTSAGQPSTTLRDGATGWSARSWDAAGAATNTDSP